MTPEQFLSDLCRRHGIERSRGEKLLPLVRRAMDSPEEVRDRVLRIVEDSIAGRVREDPRVQARDERVLVAVARVLHGWNPGDPFLTWGETRQEIKRTDEDESLPS